MKRKWCIKSFVAMLVLSVSLCGCGRKTQNVEENVNVNQTEDNNGTESQAIIDSLFEAVVFEDLYEQTDVDNIFRLNNIDIEGFGLENACLQDGYILLVLHQISDEGYYSESGMQFMENSGKMLLFPVNHPDEVQSLEIGSFNGQYTLLDNGNVLNATWDGEYALYDANLNEIFREKEPGSYLGASGSGDVWFLTENSEFVLCRDGLQIQVIPVDGVTYSEYIETNENKAYFMAYDNDYNKIVLCVDMRDWSFHEIQTLCDSYEYLNEFLSYSSEDKWYIADLEDPLMMTVFTKTDSEEVAWKMDENYLIGRKGTYNEEEKDFYVTFRVYDMQNGGFCEKINMDDVCEYDIELWDYNQGVALVESLDDGNYATKGLYLYDIRDSKATEPANSFENMDYHTDQVSIDELVQEIKDLYGVTVYYDAEHLKEYSTGYELSPCLDIDLIIYTLIKLKECMAEYPDGFFEELKGESINEIVYCLCDTHERIYEDVIDDAIATVDTIEDTLRMTIDVNYWSRLRRNFLHENMHMMMTRIEEEAGMIGNIYYVNYWFTELNSPECPSMQSYVWEQTEENLAGIYDLEHENAWYIDGYSKCTMNEDTARIMENSIYSGSAHFFESPHLDRKSRFLNAIIREAFPCVKNSKEEVFWEQRTGIVDLYQEFPDFVG